MALTGSEGPRPRSAHEGTETGALILAALGTDAVLPQDTDSAGASRLCPAPLLRDGAQVVPLGSGLDQFSAHPEGSGEQISGPYPRV